MLYNNYRESSISGKYLNLESIHSLFSKHSKRNTIKVEGFSEEDRNIHSISLGSGSFKVLMWSQMHGNESTTTKSVFDLINFLNSEGLLQKQILNKCTIKILPMLNPDGAERYTRENANKVDLNRDAQNQSQKETLVLMKVFSNFQPDLCLNLHDQRTIFSAGNAPKSAVVSFLAPAADEVKTLTKARIFAMQLISVMEKELQHLIPNQVGRYDDGFNDNCIGDTFQSLGVPTILFEAGHYPEDYSREKTREFIFKALVSLLTAVSDKNQVLPNEEHYFTIPENQKLFFDIIIRGTKTLNQPDVLDIAIQFEEKLINEQVHFIPKVKKIEGLSNFFAHKELIAKGKQTFINNSSQINISQIVKSLAIDNEKMVII